MQYSSIVLLGLDPDVCSYILEMYTSANVAQFNNELDLLENGNNYSLSLNQFLSHHFDSPADFDSALFIFSSYYPAVKRKAYYEIVQHVKNIATARRIQREILRSAFSPVISPRSYVASNAIINLGCVVAPFAYIGPSTILGRATKCNVRSSVHHDSIIGSFSTISPCATILGSVRLGRMAIVGASATLRNGVAVGNRAYIGMHSNVVSNIESHSLYFGNPARFITKLAAQ